MKKNYILVSGLILASYSVFAQDGAQRISNAMLDSRLEIQEANNVEVEMSKKNSINNKDFGDTLYYQPFSGGLPAGWRVENNNNTNDFEWQWDTEYTRGQFTPFTQAISSPTASDGFMVLNSDAFNTPFPAGGPVEMNTFFESDDIDLTNAGANPSGFGSILISYAQSFSFCCNAMTNRLVLQVSSDNFASMEEFDVTNNVPPNLPFEANRVINISSAAANQTSIKIRFLSEGNTHYFWMIDDVAIIEGPTNDLDLEQARPEFGFVNFNIRPVYTQIPLDLVLPIGFTGTVRNNGSDTARNASFQTEILNIASGNSVFNESVAAPEPLAFDSTFDAQITTTTGGGTFTPSELGNFLIELTAVSSVNDENFSNNRDTLGYQVTNDILARDDNGFAGPVSPANFVTASGIPGGTAAGDRMGTMFVIQQDPNGPASGDGRTVGPLSISYRVSADEENVGSSILPVIWEFNENTTNIPDGLVGDVVASSFTPRTITTNDLDSWITVELTGGSAFENGFEPGQYLVGWETTSNGGTTNFSVLNDISTSLIQPIGSTLLFFGHDPSDGWGIVGANPGIRLNLNLAVSLDEVVNVNTAFSISPNPNNGEFKLDVAADGNSTYNLNVRNMLGQSVHTEVVSVNGQFTKQLDLTAFEKGVYFVSLENRAEKIVKKVILK